MISSNHMLAGVTIATIIKNPTIALPVAFASHFVLDALPHFGFPKERGFKAAFTHRISYFALLLELVVWPLALYGAITSGWLVLVAGLLAASPDLYWVFEYFYYERRHREPKENWFTKFHRNIQWGEFPAGIAIEYVSAAVLGLVLFKELA